MNTTAIGVSVLLAALVAAGGGRAVADPPSVPTVAADGWGPSWVGGGPPGGWPRPQKLDAAQVRSTVTDDESRLGVAVRLWADAQVVPGHEYQLLYQLRLQTNKGEDGPLLGEADKPGGTVCPLATAKADDKWNGIEAGGDLTRKDLSAMTNLPKGKVSTVRVEPQLFDKTDGKYVTVPRTSAIVVEVDVGDGGHVDAVRSLRKWIGDTGQYETDAVAETLANLDTYDADGNHVADALGDLLLVKDLGSAAKVRLLHAVQKDWVYEKNPSLWQAVTAAAKDDDAAVRSVAAALLPK